MENVPSDILTAGGFHPFSLLQYFTKVYIKSLESKFEALRFEIYQVANVAINITVRKIVL